MTNKVGSFLAALVAVGVMAGGPAIAQESSTLVPAVPQAGAEAGEWQAVISGQIAAFRKGDGSGALSFASRPFRDGFSDPGQFLTAIAAWGYGPLLTSRSESFEDYTLIAPDEVVQMVTVLGEDMRVYRVIYDLLREAEGWRVKAVQMQPTAGMGA